MSIEYYYEIYKATKYSTDSEYINYNFETMGIIEAKNALEAFNELQKRVNTTNELSDKEKTRYRVRNLREI